MLTVEHISSLDRPELEPYRTMKYQFEHRQQGIFVAEGEKVVRRLVESRLEVVSVMVPSKWLADYQRLLAGRAAQDIRIFVAEKNELEKLVGFSMYQGVMAVGKVPSPRQLDELITRRPVLLVAADKLSNSLNMGVLVRNCAAFGADGLLAGETCCSPFIRRAVRASMGTVFQLPTLESASLAHTLRELKSRGIRCIAAHPHSDRRTLTQADFTGDCCVVLGSEGEGIDPAVLAECDDSVEIPMPPDVDSLNVGSAAAVFLYEACRQRGGM